ncbi:Holliday junction resolvase RuvX [Mycoplasma sp. CSL7491-lung]|uniref:Holliday junction resolvase RuvX n=1 Tax=Mycoplasma sp. CSL7491-lung TaxID=549718 RepID=UPI001C10BFEF|nr:Holliday junction resolvase RuvX [Mycoplasma sp. CSL7491-lung]MBU4692699.1 Holliday junction resolvase RuvX [Mycoplasma sp. CSL7491-lung]
MRKLGLDLGIKSCGFAITDESEIISSSIENFMFEENNFNLVIERIKYYLSIYKIDGFVLGYPLKISGDKSDRTLMVEKFKILLEKNFEIPVMLVNEQYSTKRAKEILKQGGLNTTKSKKYKDSLAAQIILNDYLDYYKHKWGK